MLHEHDQRQQNSMSTRPMTRNSSQYTQPRQPSAGTRSVNNVSFMSDLSKPCGKTLGTESSANLSTTQLKLVDNLTIVMYLKDLKKT